MSALLNPDCRDGKHQACYGDGWDLERDEPANCPCDCHKGKCQTCNGHGECAWLTTYGYDSEQCPDCNGSGNHTPETETP